MITENLISLCSFVPLVNSFENVHNPDPKSRTQMISLANPESSQSTHGLRFASQ